MWHTLLKRRRRSVLEKNNGHHSDASVQVGDHVEFEKTVIRLIKHMCISISQRQRQCEVYLPCVFLE